MKRVTATEGRRLLFRLLDEVEQGEEVILERAGVRFRLALDAAPTGRAALPESPFVVKDPTVLEGQWSWLTDEDGELTYEAHSDE
jgi:hypothetical protein